METYYTFKAFKGDNCVHSNTYYKTLEQAEMALQTVLDFSVAGFDRGFILEITELKELKTSITQKVMTWKA